MAKTPQPEQRELVCKLSKPEVDTRSKRQSDCVEEIKGLKEQRRGLTAEINELNAEIAKLAPVIISEEEKRMVDCKWVELKGKNAWQLVRQDTREVVDTRAMTANDLQVDLELDEVVSDAAPANDNGRARKPRAHATQRKAAKVPRVKKSKTTRHVHA